MRTMPKQGFTTQGTAASDEVWTGCTAGSRCTRTSKALYALHFWLTKHLAYMGYKPWPPHTSAAWRASSSFLACSCLRASSLASTCLRSSAQYDVMTK